MDSFEIDAVFEQGMLKLAEAVPLRDGQRVKVTIHDAPIRRSRIAGLVPWHGTVEDLDYLLGPDNHPWSRDE